MLARRQRHLGLAPQTFGVSCVVVKSAAAPTGLFPVRFLALTATAGPVLSLLVLIIATHTSRPTEFPTYLTAALKDLRAIAATVALSANLGAAQDWS